MLNPTLSQYSQRSLILSNNHGAPPAKSSLGVFLKCREPAKVWSSALKRMMSGACAEAVIVLRNVRSVVLYVCKVLYISLRLYIRIHPFLWISLYRKSHTTPRLPVLTTTEAPETYTLTRRGLIRYVSKAEQFTPLAGSPGGTVHRHLKIIRHQRYANTSMLKAISVEARTYIPSAPCLGFYSVN
jgi:hypothetical protein